MLGEYQIEAVFMAINKREVLIGVGSAALSGIGDAGAAKNQSGPPIYTLSNGDAVMSLLASTPFVTFGSGSSILYELSFRACGPCITFARSGARDVVRAGFQVRSFIFAPKSSRGNGNAGEGQIAAVAEIYRTRDAAFFEAWYRSSNVEGFARSRGIADLATNDPARQAVAEGGAKVKALSELFKQTPNLTRWGFPVFIWRNASGVHAKFGYGTARGLLADMRRA
jgi:hypothetical protein